MSGKALIHMGSVYDIECTLKCSWKYYSINDLKTALEYEQKHYKRSTVVRMLQRAIKRKEKEHNAPETTNGRPFEPGDEVIVRLHMPYNKGPENYPGTILSKTTPGTGEDRPRYDIELMDGRVFYAVHELLIRSKKEVRHG